MKTEIWAMGLVILATVFSSFAPLILKIGMNNRKVSLVNIIFNLKIIIGIVLYLISTLFYVIALKGGELSVLYPLVSFSYILVTFNSRIFLKERIGKFKIIGIFFVILGIVIIGLTN